MPNFTWSNKPAANQLEVKLTFGDCIRHFSINTINENDVLSADNITLLVDGQNYGDFSHGPLAWDYISTFK